MGMFDTFKGVITCPHCGKITHFEEQTKSYDCLLKDLKVGDYIDFATANYFYKLNQHCQHCKTEIEIHAVIRRGQLVDFVIDITGLDINSFTNIEEGFQRKVEYALMYHSGYGFDESLYDTKFNIGDTINILNREWKVDKVFEERLIVNHENEAASRFAQFMFKNNRCYQVHDDNDNKRLIIVREKQPTYITALIGCETDDEYSTYYKAIGTELVEIS